MKKNFKIIIAIFITIGVLAAFYAYKEFNRKAEPLNKVTTEVYINSDSLLAEFIRNEEQANQNFLNKVIQVNGVLTSHENSNILIIEMPNGNIRCTLDSLANNKNLNNMLNKPIKIKGLCVGYTPDVLGIGPDISLIKCFIQ
jgi:uncharacterized protein (UPF0333 family)